MKTIKTLARYLKGVWGVTVLTWVLVLLESVCEVGIAFMLQFLSGAVNDAANGLAETAMEEVYLYSGIIFGLAIMGAVTGIIAGFTAARAATGFGRNLRQGEYYKIQSFSFDNIDKFSTSSIVTRLTTDVTNVQNAFMQIIRAVMRSPFLLIISITMAFITAPEIAWVFLIVVPILLVVLIVLATVVHPLFVKVFDTYDELNEDVQENLDGIRVVKSFNLQDKAKEKFSGVSLFIFKCFSKAEKILAFNAPSMQFAVYATMVALAVVGGNLIISGVYDPGVLTTFFMYVQLIFLSLMLISMVYTMIIIARNSAERIAELLNEEPNLVSPQNGLKEVENGSIDFDHVDFGYLASGGKKVLHDIDLHIKSGQSIGIIGGIGSGKTTLISLIARLYDVSSGEVKVAGHDVRDYDLYSLRESVAVVLQKNTIFTGTIRDNLKWGNENATEDEIVEACRLAQADGFISSFPDKYNTMLVEGGTNVSGGQKQRLCIARALLKKPKILILDDSTNAVDTHTDALIRDELQHKMPGLTRIIIAQRILSIRDCDEIYVMDEGKIIASGNNDELMKNCSIYKELYDSQLGGGDFDE